MSGKRTRFWVTRFLAAVALCGSWAFAFGQDAVSSVRPPSPEELVQRQIDAWNRHNADDFVAPYSDSTSLYLFPDKLIRQFTSKQELRDYYGHFFENNPNLHCEVAGQLVSGNTVILLEKVTGRADGRNIESIVTYKIVNNQIARVYFDYRK
ncbi:nuclear transport factor 2 family protein [Larkinella soli]|uniref:nuclear transport factor 2 family protein n=1 Tax=Larkinella soli TaxID=1770527 RepID=UPI0013E2A1D1|nr:nuclear transport factor 2 family protein [Larkinella soli]